LQIDAEFAKGFDIGMAHLISSLTTSAADITYSRHNIGKVIKFIKFVKFIKELDKLYKLSTL